MQPGYPGSGQEPYGTQPPYPDPYAQPRYSAGAQAERHAAGTPEPNEPAQPGEPAVEPAAAAPSQNPVPGPPAADPPAPAPPATGANTRGLVGMVLGVVSIPGAFCTVLGVPFAIVCGALAVGFGIAGLRRVRAGVATNRGQSVTGVACGAIGIVIGLLAAFAITYNGVA